MNFHEALAKLQSSSEFAEFKKQNSSAYLCAAFFIIDSETGMQTQQLDFFIPEKNIVFAFSIDGEIKSKEGEMLKQEKPRGIEEKKIKIELEKAIEIAKKQENAKKIIASLQNEEKQIWNISCILESLSILNLHIDASNGKIIKKEKRGILDFVKKS